MTRAAPVRRVDPASFDLSATARAMLDAGLMQRPASAQSAVPMQWHPAFVAPTTRSAERVETFIGRLGLRCWWPVETAVQKRPRRSNVLLPTLGGASRWVKQVVIRPLWPRYVLVELPCQDAPFGKLSDDRARQHGLYGIIATGDGPAVIPTTIVEDLQRRQAAGEWDATERRRGKVMPKRPDWAIVGGQVEVADGPFASFNATIESIIGERARVSVAIFGRVTPVDVELDQLRPGR